MKSHLDLYVHLVWATLRRKPIVSAAVEMEVYRAIGTKCVELGCAPCAIGGTADHVHLLARLHPSIAVARLAAEVKGVSSHAVARRLSAGARFQWQHGYGAFSLSVNDLPMLQRYVLNQKDHHAHGTVDPDLESVEAA